MESNVFPLPISNGHDTCVPGCLRFTVNLDCSLFLLATSNPRHLTRSPLKEGSGLLNGRLTSEPDETVKADRPPQQSENVLDAFTGSNVVIQLNQKGHGDFSKSRGQEKNLTLG